MKVYYKLFFNSKSFEDKNEPDYLLQYAYKKDDKINQVNLEIKKRGYISKRIISKMIKDNTPDLKNEKIFLEIQDSKSLSALAKCFS